MLIQQGRYKLTSFYWHQLGSRIPLSYWSFVKPTWTSIHYVDLSLDEKYKLLGPVKKVISFRELTGCNQKIQLVVHEKQKVNFEVLNT